VGSPHDERRDLRIGHETVAHIGESPVRATQFDRDATQANLAAQIATDYLQYRLYQLQYAIATRSAESQAEVVRITRLRFEQGAASRLDLEQVVSQLAVTRAAVPQAFEQANAARNALILLLASTPAALATDLPPAIVADNPQLPAGDPLEVLLTPAQVIEQRPDVRAAEFRLVSAAANLKSALAQRYPQLTLGGMFGSAGTAVNQLTTPGAVARGYSCTLTLPIFDFGRIRAAIDTVDARQLQAYLSYEQTVRGALQATQTATVIYARLRCIRLWARANAGENHFMNWPVGAAGLQKCRICAARGRVRLGQVGDLISCRKTAFQPEARLSASRCLQAAHEQLNARRRTIEQL
jgi:outer membrane protein TolC